MYKLIVLTALLVLAGIVLRIHYQSGIQAIEAPAIASRRQPLAPATGPLRIHPSNTRYFTDGSGKAIYLTGSSFYWNFQDGGTTDPPAAYDYTGYLNFLQAHDHNFIRLWRFEQTRYGAGPTYVAPHPWKRTGPGNALDGKPKFDLTQLDQTYFNRLRTRVIAARDLGIYVSIMLFGGTEQHVDANPMHRTNNVNGLNGDSNGDGVGSELQRLPLPAGVEKIQKAYLRKIIDTVNDLDNVLYEIVNESGTYSTSWQYDLINYIKIYQAERPKQHPVGMTWQWSRLSGTGTNAILFASPADWISPSAEGGYDTNPPAAVGTKVVLADTDHIHPVHGESSWIWKSFTRGMNPIIIDEGIGSFPPPIDQYEPYRHAMGQTRTYADKMNLAAMVPRSDLCSTTYCLVNPGKEYLIFAPPRRRHSIPLVASFFKSVITVDLSAAPVTFNVEWFNPRTGETIDAGTTIGGTSRNLSAPFGGDAVLYLKSR